LLQKNDFIIFIEEFKMKADNDFYKFIFETMDFDDLKSICQILDLEKIGRSRDERVKIILSKMDSFELEEILINISKYSLRQICYSSGIEKANTKTLKGDLIKFIIDHYLQVIKNKTLDKKKEKQIIENKLLPKENKIEQNKYIPSDANQSLFNLFPNSNSELNEKEVKNNVSIGVQLNDVISWIKSCKIKYYHYSKFKEDILRDSLFEHLLEYIPRDQVSKEYPIGTKFGLKIDLDILHESFGIEVKKRSSLRKVGECERAIGQAYLYSKKRYTNNNLIFLVIGEKNDDKEDNMFELKKFINELNVNFVFLEVVHDNV